MTEKYDITDYLKDDKELQKAVIEEFLKENAELKAENMEIKTSYINFIAKLKREMITKDDIQDLKNTVKKFVEERNSLKAENERLKSQLDFEVQKKEVFETENERLKTQYNCYACGNCKGKEDYINLEKHHIGLRKQFDKKVQTLQEIKAIADARCNECKYGKDGITCKFGDCGEAKLHLITQLITKAEEE